MYKVTCKRTIGVQAGCSTVDRREKGTQCSDSKASYGRLENPEEHLLRQHLWDKEFLICWLKEEGLIASRCLCTICQSHMKWVECSDRSDDYAWECRKQLERKRHRHETGIREGSWFAKVNLTIEGVIKFTYWWCQGLQQWQIKQQLNLSSHTAVDWDMFCRELCEVAMFESREKVGGPGGIMQIDEGKIGKREYHRGHVVKGQWVLTVQRLIRT